MKPSPYPASVKAEAIRRMVDGESVRHVSDALGVPADNVRWWRNRDPDAIAAHRKRAGKPKHEPTQLPLLYRFELGSGNRREDCARYEECLQTFGLEHPTTEDINEPDPDARCPRGCRGYEPESKHIRVALATRRRDSQWSMTTGCEPSNSRHEASCGATEEEDG